MTTALTFETDVPVTRAIFPRPQIIGSQRANGENLIDALTKVAREANSPLHLFPGRGAQNMAAANLAAVQKDLKEWRETATSTDFEAAKTA